MLEISPALRWEVEEFGRLSGVFNKGIRREVYMFTRRNWPGQRGGMQQNPGVAASGGNAD